MLETCQESCHIPFSLFSQRCAETISLLAETLRGERLQETELAKRLLGILARLSRRRPAQEAIAASCFAGWAAEVLRNALMVKEALRQRRGEDLMVWLRQRHLLACCLVVPPGEQEAVRAHPAGRAEPREVPDRHAHPALQHTGAST